MYVSFGPWIFRGAKAASCAFSLSLSLSLSLSVRAYVCVCVLSPMFLFVCERKPREQSRPESMIKIVDELANRVKMGEDAAAKAVQDLQQQVAPPLNNTGKSQSVVLLLIAMVSLARIDQVNSLKSEIYALKRDSASATRR